LFILGLIRPAPLCEFKSVIRRPPDSIHRILISKLSDGGYGNYAKENNEKIQTLSLSAMPRYPARHWNEKMDV
jgi:hypothetical protein